MAFYANLAKISYQKGVDRKNNSTFLKREYGLQPVKELSNDSTASYVNPRDGKLYISFRGTDTSSLKNAVKDLGTDVALALGGLHHTDRWREDEQLLARAIKQFGKENVVLTGHSLGAKLGSDLAHKYGVEAHVFNVGSSPIDALNELNPTKQIQELANKRAGRGSKVYHYNTAKDPISISDSLAQHLSSNPDNLVIVKQKPHISPHNLDNFTIQRYVQR